MVKLNKAKAIDRLQRALEKIPELKQQEHMSKSFNKWRRDTRVTIEKVFINQPQRVEEFTKVNFWLRVAPVPESEYQVPYIEGLEPAAAVLESMIEEIEEYWEDEHQEPQPPLVRENGPLDTKEVFIVHGRDDEAKETVARFLDRLGLSPVILHEQPNQGRTIIEKFEQHAHVGFALALLTPDDLGALQENKNILKPRARQNVIFEFGYFIGRLGRERVCALTKGDIEIPSDYEGVIYIPLDDSEGWKMKLVKEFKNAGLDVDANRAF